MKITFTDIKEGLYRAEVAFIKEGNSRFGPFLRLIFTITEGQLKHYRFSGFVNPSPLKQRKFYRWVTNILGEEPQSEFSTDSLIGKQCLVYLSKGKKDYLVTDVAEKKRGRQSKISRLPISNRSS